MIELAPPPYPETLTPAPEFQNFPPIDTGRNVRLLRLAVAHAIQKGVITQQDSVDIIRFLDAQ